MQNAGYGLLRIPLLRTPVNKGVPSLSAPVSFAVSSKAQRVRVGFDQPPVILLGGLYDALPRGPLRAESGSERAVLATQDDYVRV
jgi:hypothetical protein